MTIKRVIIYSLIVTVVAAGFVMGIYSSVAAHLAKNLYNYASKNDTVNIYIGDFSPSDRAKEIDPARLAEAFEVRLRDRKTVRFNVVDRVEDADLAVSGRIKIFRYLDKDPVDILIPIGLVIDLLTQKNFARLDYTVSVLDTKKKKVVWKRALRATLTEFEVPKEKSIPLIIDRAAYVFIKECFGKPKSDQNI